ncbi:MAG: MBL fold metallo-hydrolase [bacterium]|nr:MBL fold metallo-hydrolase [bacterium]
MTITSPTTETIQIRTKNSTICLGEPTKVDDFVLNGPGEYEIGGVEVNGVGRIYLFSTEEIRLAYLDKLNHLLNDEEQELVADVDILFIPVGGADVLDVKTAIQIINQIEPKIVIPMYYETIDNFSKEEGIVPEFTDSLKITSSALPETERKVIVLPWKSSKKL